MKYSKFLQIIYSVFILFIVASCQTTPQYEFEEVDSIEEDWEWQTQARIEGSDLPDGSVASVIISSIFL